MKPAALLLASCLLATTAAAETFPSDAPTYPIIEPDMVEAIKDKLRAMEKSGRLAELQKAYQDKITHAITDPAPLPGFTKVVKDSSRLFDPSIELTKDIVDNRGRLIAQAGQRINPLHYMSMPTKYVFIDATDPAQKSWAHDLITKDPLTKIILVAGSYYRLSEEFGRAVYFDQTKAISKRFGINKVPTMISQQNNMVLIHEIALPR